MQNYCFGLTYERSYLTFPAPKIVDPKSSKVYQVDPLVGFKLYKAKKFPKTGSSTTMRYSNR